MGDPAKAARILIEFAASDAPPLHLFLGADAHKMASEKIGWVEADLSAWKMRATATDLS